MPRTKMYKREEVLDRAMKLFWQRGYEGASLQQLEHATGINRYGIYDSFGSKHALFLEALDHYLDTFVRDLFGVLEQAGIEQFFATFAELARSDKGKWGCFVCDSATELAPHDEEVAARVARYTAWLNSAFRHAVARAQEKGEIDASRPADALAQSLTVSTLGLFVYAKSPVSREQVAQACREVATLG